MMNELFRPKAAIQPSASEVAEWTAGTLVGGDLAPAQITGLGTLEEATPDEIAFVAEKKHIQNVPSCAAKIIVCPRESEISDRARIEVDDVWGAIAEIMRRLYPGEKPKQRGIHETAIIGSDCKIDPGATVGPYCVIGDRVEIEKDVWLHAHVAIASDCKIGPGSQVHPHVGLQGIVHIGANVLIHSGVMIGADGFKFVPGKQGAIKIPQVGRVVIEDEVEIGAATTIDRAFLYETRIGRGTKLDNQVLIAHNVRIGCDCLIAGRCAISGSVTVGDGCLMGGDVGIRDGVTIGAGCMITSRSGVSKDFEPGSIVSGFPATENRKNLKVQAHLRRLPAIMEKLKKLDL